MELQLSTNKTPHLSLTLSLERAQERKTMLVKLRIKKEEIVRMKYSLYRKRIMGLNFLSLFTTHLINTFFMHLTTTTYIV